MGVLEICVVIFVLIIGLPILFRLLRALGPVIAVLIGIAVAVGLVVLAANVVGAMVSGAFELLFGPLGLLLLGGAAVYYGYRQWNKRQIRPAESGGARGKTTYIWPEKPKHSEQKLEIGDDGEIITLDELLDEDDTPKRKRG